MHRIMAFALSIAAAPAFAGPCAGFSDVDDSNPFCVNVAWIKNRNVTLGCSPQALYCPNDAVSRLSIAAFLNRLGDVLLPPNVIWVAPAGGMFQSIQSAIDYAAALPPGARKLVKVAPGTYNETVAMAQSVDVEGSGEHATFIEAEAPCSAGLPSSGTVTGASGAQLRNLSVISRNIGTTSGGCAAVNLTDAIGPSLRDVSIVIAVGGSAVGYGVMTSPPANPSPITLDRVSIRAEDVGAGQIFGVVANGSDVFPHATVALRDVRFGHAADFTVGVGYRLNNVIATLDRTVAYVVNGSSSPESVALSVEGAVSAVNVERSSLRVPSGVFRPGGQYATVSDGATLRIANSQLEGSSTGAITCFQNYDPNFAPFSC